MLSKARDARAKERKKRNAATKAEARAEHSPNVPSNCSPPYLPIPPSCDTTLPARHWYNVEFERSRSAMTGALESLIPTTNAALALAYGRHYGHVAITRLRDLDTSRPVSRTVSTRPLRDAQWSAYSQTLED